MTSKARQRVRADQTSAAQNARQRARLAAEQAARRQQERRRLGIVALAVVVLLVAGGIGLQAYRTTRDPKAGGPGSVGFAPVTVTNFKPLRLGKTGAPVTVTLYEDFECPHCGQFEKTFGSTLTAAQDSGQVQIDLYTMAFEDQYSAPAANAMACAAQAGFGQDYYVGLFANQGLQWTADRLIQLGRQVHPNPPGTFSTCVQTNAMSGYVDSIQTVAQHNGVNSTPRMFLNGKPVDIANLTVDKLKSMLASGNVQ